MERVPPAQAREERLRYDVLYAIYDAADRLPCVQIDSGQFLRRLGVVRADVNRLVGFLADCSFLSLGDESLEARSRDSVACITQRGIDYIQRDARRRRTVRDELLGTERG